MEKTTQNEGRMDESGERSGSFSDYGHYSVLGKAECHKVGGDPKLLENFLFMLYDQDNVTSTLRHDINEKLEENARYEKEIRSLRDLEQSVLHTAEGVERERDLLISDKRAEISNQQAEIKRIRGGDYSLLGVQADAANKPAFWAALFILILVTIYLISFYASVLYNAFLLDPIKLAQQNAELENIATSVTIVNLDAFYRVYGEFGWLGVIFLLTGAFVFITLGFLLHWFSKTGRIYWIITVYLFTFLFDAFLAYEVVRKIHESSAIYQELPAWKMKFAFEKADFYIILFAGFGIYVAWGLLFRYLQEEYHKILPAITGIRKRKAEIARLGRDIREVTSLMDKKINQLKSEATAIRQTEVDYRVSALRRNENDIKELRRNIRQNARQNKQSIQQLRTQVTFFMSGWCEAIRIDYNGQSEEKIQACHESVDKFFQTIGYN